MIEDKLESLLYTLYSTNVYLSIDTYFCQNVTLYTLVGLLHYFTTKAWQ